MQPMPAKKHDISAEERAAIDAARSTALRLVRRTVNSAFTGTRRVLYDLKDSTGYIVARDLALRDIFIVIEQRRKRSFHFDAPRKPPGWPE